jgi:hypothetical protein
MQVAETYCVRPLLLSPSFVDSSGLDEHELSLWLPAIADFANKMRMKMEIE